MNEQLNFLNSNKKESDINQSTIIPNSLLDKFGGALVYSAIGDALGWPTEFGRYPNIVQKRFGKYYITDYIEWEKLIGGRYWGYREKIKEGSYSDDTQLTLSVARCIDSYGDFDADKFAYSELPLWLSYERGGGKTIKTAARAIMQSKKEWFLNFYKRREIDYRYAGANGAAMRIIPIALVNVNNEKRLYSDSFKNAIITHGHPRAILGSMIYASAINLLLKETNISREKICDYLREVIETSSKFLKDIEWIRTWIQEWDKGATNGKFKEVFQQTRNEAKNYLDSIKKFLLLEDKNYYQLTRALGEYKGSGISTVCVALYLFIKYIDNPEQGIIKAVNMLGSDTDTIANFVGGLFGTYYGLSVIRKDLKERLQDKDYILKIASQLHNIVTGKSLINHVPIKYFNKKELLLKILAWEIGLREMFWEALNEGDTIIHPALGKGKISRKETQNIQKEGYVVKLIEVIFDCGQTCIFHSRVANNGELSDSLSKDLIKQKLTYFETEK
ncbi:MAG: ADP-ribosylglycohydrolase family protein [Thermodesulfovibrio sp.]|nr:ADP-ribosylglycohydrolase family protein [Thermodesulfovibrio sp.]